MTDKLEEAVARVIALHFDIDPDIFIGMHGRNKWEKQWLSIARAVIPIIRNAAMDEAAAARPSRSVGKPPDGKWGGDYQCGWDDAVVAYAHGVLALKGER